MLGHQGSNLLGCLDNINSTDPYLYIRGGKRLLGLAKEQRTKKQRP